MFRGVLKYFIEKPPLNSASPKVDILPCVLYIFNSVVQFFGGLVIIIFVDILKIGSIDILVIKKLLKTITVKLKCYQLKDSMVIIIIGQVSQLVTEKTPCGHYYFKMVLLPWF